jgi:Mrp family chromosome partitioning ATPase
MVLSGKGGVGKSSVAVNLAATLSKKGFQVGLLDIDFHGPSVPTMLGLQNCPRPPVLGDKLQPIEAAGLKVISVAFLQQNKSDAIIWRGPMKAGVLKQLIEDVAWGELDYLIMDFPPGTGDEALSACQLVKDADGGIIVTTPQEVSLSDCRRCINFCDQVSLPVLGVVENMSGLVCPSCDHRFHLFTPGGGEQMASEMNVPFLGRLPLDPRMAKCCDEGTPFVLEHPQTLAASAFVDMTDTLIANSSE